MARPTTSLASRSAGFMPFVAGLASALALTGAAVFTVEEASCGDPGRYVRHDDHVEFAGGCLDGSELPRTGPGDSHSEPVDPAPAHHRR